MSAELSLSYFLFLKNIIRERRRRERKRDRERESHEVSWIVFFISLPLWVWCLIWTGIHRASAKPLCSPLIQFVWRRDQSCDWDMMETVCLGGAMWGLKEKQATTRLPQVKLSRSHPLLLTPFHLSSYFLSTLFPPLLIINESEWGAVLNGFMWGVIVS